MDSVILEPVEYGAKGAMSISLWVKKREHHNDVGEGYQFLLSTISSPDGHNITDASQVCIDDP